MSFAWSAASFCYYMIHYYVKYLKGSIYVNNFLANFAEIVGLFASGLIIKRFGVKRDLIISYIMAVVFAVVMYAIDSQIASYFAILMMKFSISNSFNAVYQANYEFFPTELLSKSFFVCNVISRLVTVASPMIAEAPEPIPLFAFIIFCGVACLASMFV